SKHAGGDAGNPETRLAEHIGLPSVSDPIDAGPLHSVSAFGISLHIQYGQSVDQTFDLTYEDRRSNVFVYADAAATDRCRAGNSDRSLEPRGDDGARGPRDDCGAEADPVYDRAEDHADHGGERARAS